MNFKGDWKYLKQLFLFTKDASKEEAGKTEGLAKKLHNAHIAMAAGMFLIFNMCMLHVINLHGRFAGSAIPQRVRMTWTMRTQTFLRPQLGGTQFILHTPGLLMNSLNLRN